MLSHIHYNLTVIITTCDRHKLFKRCLEYLPDKKSLSFRLEIIVVDESDNKVPDEWLKNVDQIIKKDKQGLWGAYAKDAGISVANGEFVCFWDDDNIFYDHALHSIYNTAAMHDVGVVQTKFDDGVIPFAFTNKFVHAQIDTMCFCVRTVIAKRHLWVDGRNGRNTDFRWITKVASSTNNINFKPIIIGELQ